MSILPFSGNLQGPKERNRPLLVDDHLFRDSSPASSLSAGHELSEEDQASAYAYSDYSGPGAHQQQQSGKWPFFEDNYEYDTMQSSGPKPTIVIIPSSFSNRTLYSDVISRLEVLGYEVMFAQLPSIVRRKDIEEKQREKTPVKLGTMEDDADFIRSLADQVADEGKHVVLVAHSYSGIPMTESVRGSTKAEREAVGKTGGITALVYVSAFIPRIGESLMTTMSELHPGEADLSQVDEHGIMYLDPVINARSTFSDLPEAEGIAWSGMMENHSFISFSGQVTYEGWRHIPVTYLHTENDLIIPLRIQIEMVERVREFGINVEVVTCSSGHCPNVSAVEEFVEAVRKGAGERRRLSKPTAAIYVETNTVTETHKTEQE